MEFLLRPNRLVILPGLKWQGNITVLQKLDDGKYLVDFDAIDPEATQERHVLDRASLDPNLLEQWTGWRESDIQS